MNWLCLIQLIFRLVNIFGDSIINLFGEIVLDYVMNNLIW